MNQRETALNELVDAELKKFKENFLKRLDRMGMIVAGWDAPTEVAEYLDNAHLCYLHGIFISSILTASTAIETAFRVKYFEKTKKKDDIRFEQMIIWAEKNAIIEKKQAQRIQAVRKNIRNKLVHAKPLSKEELDKVYLSQNKKFEELTVDERNRLFLYYLKTQPDEQIAVTILEIADEVVQHLFPSIGKIPYSGQ